MTIRPVLLRSITPMLAVLIACGGEPATEEATDMAETSEAPAPIGSVTILEPTEGAEIDGSDVTVRLDVSGVRIVPAGDTTSTTGHHHLYLNADLTPSDQPVPTIAGEIIHMGDGSAEYVFTDVPTGEHRLIAVVADGVHVPLQPWVVDTVHFRVR